jgi:nitroimidazol reductase NimA-like FMN-containing flavoprotein (pyridoxamine 5'-phosphate oxidase superfamily)
MERPRPIRRKERTMTEADIEKFILEHDICHLAVNGKKGYPCILLGNYIYKNGIFILHGITQGCKSDCLKADNRGALEISEMFSITTEGRIPCSNFLSKFSSVIAFGKIEILSENLKMDMLSELAPYYLEKMKEDIGAGERATDLIMQPKALVFKPQYISGKSSLKGGGK